MLSYLQSSLLHLNHRVADGCEESTNFYEIIYKQVKNMNSYLIKLNEELDMDIQHPLILARI